MTLATLRDDIRDWLTENSTTVLSDSRINQLVRFVNTDLNAMARHPVHRSKKGFRLLEMQKVKRTLSFEGDNFIDLPEDYLEMRYVTVYSEPNEPPLDYLPPERYIQEEAAGAGLLRYWTMSSGQLRVGPTIEQGEEIEMGYYGRIPDLVDDTDSNWLLEKADQVYIYGALMHAKPFLQEFDASPFNQMFLNIVVGLIDANEMAEVSRVPAALGPMKRYA